MTTADSVALLGESLRVGRVILDERARADPLRTWRFGVPRLRDAFALFTAPEPIDELHLRACNKGTKTETEAAWTIACLQKRPHLDGVPVPQWKGRIEAIQLVLDYPEQLLSVQPAYLRLLGNWPHHALYHGESLSTLYVRPLGWEHDDQRSWSVLHFRSEDKKTSGTGARADLSVFDEPPVMSILDELRKAAHAGRRGLRLIAETPTIRRQWFALQADYGDCPRSSIRRVDQDRAECRWSLHEVADWILSPAEKEQLRRSYRRSPIPEAREHGDYENAVGECPFDQGELKGVLQDMLSSCRKPEIVKWRISLEAGKEGETRSYIHVPVEVFEEPEPGVMYYGPIDPSSGVDKPTRNPAAMLFTRMGRGGLCVQWKDRIPPYSVGILAAGLGRQYNMAPLDIEMKDHWGVNVYRGTQASHYGNIAHELRETSQGVWSKEVGFDQTEKTKAVLVGCIQDWMMAWQVGAPYAKCPSRDIILSLMDTQLDDRDKVVAVPGIDHGEYFILWGQSLRRTITRSGRAIPALAPVPPTQAEERIAHARGLSDRILGKHGERGRPDALPLARSEAPKW